MKSGDPSINRANDYHRARFTEIVDKQFKQETFLGYPALVSKTPVKGHRMWKPYYGGDYDKEQFDIVKGMWDHEHCSICDFKIKNDHTYWTNENRVRILCDECHDAFISK